MFVFARVFHTPDAEKIDLLLPIGAIPDATTRFGKPLYRDHGPGHHEVGTLILLYGQDGGKKTIKVFLAGHSAMTEGERDKLLTQVSSFLSDKEYMACGGMEHSRYYVASTPNDLLLSS